MLTSAFATTAQPLSPRAQIIVDFLGLDTMFSGVIVEQDGQLLIGGYRGFVVDASLRLQVVKHVYDLRARTLASQQLAPAGLPNAEGGGTNLSSGGTCSVGFQDAGNLTPFHAFRWTQATGPIDLGTLEPANNASFTSSAFDVSDDCSVIVGTSNFSSVFLQHAFRWTASGGMVDLAPPAGATRASRAFGVSADGAVVVGDAEFADAAAFTGFRNGAYRWSGGTFQALGALTAGFPSIATAVTADGLTIVGGALVSTGPTTTGQSAFRWTAATGMVALGPLPGGTNALATAVSDNGRIVAGTTTTSGTAVIHPSTPGIAPGNGALRWTQATGQRDLRQLLVDAGVDMAGVTLLSVSGMSADGQWLAGQATTPTTPAGETVGYLLQYCDDAIGAACSSAGIAPFSVGVSNTALTVAAGASATTDVTISPSAGFTAAVGFSCSGLPTGASCSFAPSSVTPAGGPVTTTLTIGTDGGAVALLLRDYPGAALALALAPLVWFGRGARRRVRSGGWLVLLGAVVIATVAACGGGGGGGAAPGGNPPPATGTPAGNSNVTVTATSGSGATAITRTVVLSLTVTR